MLIMNDEQRHLAGVVSLEERCKYCSKAFAEYPLIDQDCPNDRHNNVLSLLFSVGKQVQRLQATPLSQGDLVLLVFPQVAGSSTRCGQILDWVL